MPSRGPSGRRGVGMRAGAGVSGLLGPAPRVGVQHEAGVWDMVPP